MHAHAHAHTSITCMHKCIRAHTCTHTHAHTGTHTSCPGLSGPLTALLPEAGWGLAISGPVWLEQRRGGNGRMGAGRQQHDQAGLHSAALSLASALASCRGWPQDPGPDPGSSLGTSSTFHSNNNLCAPSFPGEEAEPREAKRPSQDHSATVATTEPRSPAGPTRGGICDASQVAECHRGLGWMPGA